MEQARQNYLTNISYETAENRNFRTVIHTGANSQLVLMAIPPGSEIGMETHKHVEQTLFFQSGHGIALLDGVQRSLHSGDVLVVAPGTKHNVVNTGKIPLKLYTVYSPPNHIDGRVHKTKADADADEADEAFGHGAMLREDLPTKLAVSSTKVIPGSIPDIEPRPVPKIPERSPDAPKIAISEGLAFDDDWSSEPIPLPEKQLISESEVEY